jgi:hypothetical protein
VKENASLNFVQQFEKCLIVAGTKDENFIRSILQKNNVQQAVIGSIDPNQFMPTNIVTHLSMEVNKTRPKEIIFCIHEFAAKDMIQLLEQLADGIDFKIHFAGTLSIVGSRNKESAGNCFTVA